MIDKSKSAVINRLLELEYYKNVDPNTKELIIEQTFENYKDNGVIKFPWEGLNRIFSIDAESTYEWNGIKYLVESILPIFRSMGINLEIGEHVEEFDNDSETYTERTIELNGRKYDVSGVSDWGSAFNSGFKLIDEILSTFNCEERVFCLFMDESSTMIILNDHQFKYLTELIPEDSTYRPIDLKAIMG